MTNRWGRPPDYLFHDCLDNTPIGWVNTILNNLNSGYFAELHFSAHQATGCPPIQKCRLHKQSCANAKLHLSWTLLTIDLLLLPHHVLAPALHKVLNKSTCTYFPLPSIPYSFCTPAAINGSCPDDAGAPNAVTDFQQHVVGQNNPTSSTPSRTGKPCNAWARSPNARRCTLMQQLQLLFNAEPST